MNLRMKKQIKVYIIDCFTYSNNLTKKEGIKRAFKLQSTSDQCV